MKKIMVSALVLLAGVGWFMMGGCAQTQESSTTTTMYCPTTTSTTTTTTTTSSTTTSTTSTTTTTYASATLTHAGFDFATGRTTNESGYDGETIIWNPDGALTTVESTTYPNSMYCWWRGANPLDSIPHQKHIGVVELSSVTTIPSSWDSGSLIWPLLVDHVYVVMCTPEGYAEFKVTSTSTLSAFWPVGVTYYYTTEAHF